MLKELANDKIIPHLKYLIDEIIMYQNDLKLNGVEVYSSGDVFVPGKIVNGAAYVLTMIDSDEREEYKEKVKELIKFTASKEMKTWGYLNYIMGLYRLSENGLLDELLDPETLEVLKESLDWRHFVNLDDLSLINLPTNYYGVAYSVARYRELLGWDDSNFSQKLFDKLFDHVEKYSGECLFMDETAGEGRFDRYSILIPGEVCSTLSSTGLEIPETLLKMLRQSANICLSLANETGNGISYGRSIGAYGDTAVLEILSIAAKLGILTDDEIEIAYGYNVKIVEKFVSFWIDPTMKSINMWENGRRTDGYRHKGRILGENFSLCCQVLHIYHQWIDAGYQDKSINKDWNKMISNLPRYNYFPFAKGKLDRGLAVIRDNEHVFSVPFINGGGGTSGDVNGKRYYCASAYLPIPFELRTLEVPADTHYAQLTPRITTKNGDKLMNIAYMKNIITDVQENCFTVSYTQDCLCNVDDGYPEQDDSVKSEVKFVFKANTIEKEEAYFFDNYEDIVNIKMEFLTYSKDFNIDNNKVLFENGPIESIEIEGLNILECSMLDDSVENNTSHQKLESIVTFNYDEVNENSIKIKSIIRYR